MANDKKSLVLLFDGVCHLCDGAVRFILKREKISELRFSPLQSNTGRKLLKKYGYPEDYLDGLVLIKNQRAYDQSSACLRVARYLKFPWNLFFILLVIPKPIRDLFCGLIATLRYRCFGRKDTCALPQGCNESRFI